MEPATGMKINEYKTKSGKPIRLIQGDCMEWLEDCRQYDLAIVDPPYGNKSDATKTFTSNSINKASDRTEYKQFDQRPPTINYFNKLKEISNNQIIWGGNYFNGITGGVIAWNKNGTAFGEGEVAICSTHKSVRFYECTWNGMLQHDMKDKQQRIHPTEKPIKLYRWLLQNYAEENDTILDTHGGSMSLAIACYIEDYALDIIELDEDYYSDAVKRFENHISQKTLF